MLLCSKLRVCFVWDYPPSVLMVVRCIKLRKFGEMRGKNINLFTGKLEKPATRLNNVAGFWRLALIICTGKGISVDS